MAKYIPETADLNQVVMDGEELKDAITSVVRTFSSDFDTDCIFVGNGAATDGDRVILPNIDPEADVTLEQAHIIGGYANHETLHKLLTDFKGLNKWAPKWGKFTRHMQNAIEDVRIENGGRTLYNGIVKQIDQTAKSVNRKFIDEVYPQQPEIVNDFGKIGAVAVTWAGRYLMGYPDPSNKEALDLLPEDIRDKVLDIARQAMKIKTGCVDMGKTRRATALKGSRETMALAEKICDDYMDEQAKQQQQGNGQGEDGQGDDNDTQQGQQGAGDAQGEGDGNSQGDDTNQSGQAATGGREEGDGGDEQGNASSSGQEGQGDDEEDETPDGDSGGVGPGVSQGVDLEEPDSLDPELSAHMQKVFDDVNSGAPMGYKVWIPEADVVQTTELDENKEYNRQVYLDTKQRASGSMMTIKRKLERVLLELKDTLWENGARSGRLDVRRNAAKVVQFNRNVYRRREQEQDVNAAIMLLIDQSGSMRGAKNRVASEACIALCEALQPTGVPIEVMGHYTAETPKYKQAIKAWYDGKLSGKDPSDFGRYAPIEYPLYKRFEDDVSAVRHRFGYMAQLRSNGGNADGDAILFAAKQLLKRDEPRKIMFVFSDGEPAWGCGGGYCSYQWTRDCIEWVRLQGIDLVGIGIKSNAVAQFYPDYIVVKNLAEFSQTAMDKMVKTLLGRGEKNNDVMSTKVRRGQKF